MLHQPKKPGANRVKGCCIIKVYQVYVGSCKTMTLSIEEIMATNLILKHSYFDEYEEMVSAESSSEED